MDSDNQITDDFKKLMKDFINDILNTFPEYHDKFTEDELEFLKISDNNQQKMQNVFDYCLTVYPERFFDILYENDELFLDEEKNTKFFKNINFKEIWNSDISENTKQIIWKYLQLILFCITNNLDDTTCFKDTAKLFEAIDENELKQKLEEVVSSINNVFDISGENSNDTENIHEINNLFKNMMGKIDLSNNMNEKDFEEMMKKFMNNKSPNFEEMMKTMDISGLGIDFMDMMKNMEGFNDMSNNIFNDMSNNIFNDMSNNFKNIPNPNDLQDHLNSLMGGKIGQLAQEIANDTAKDLDIDPENISNVDDVFAKLFKNPGKLMGMIKKVSATLDEKLKSGELKETELMKEASELVDKMKNTPGMKNMENMLNKMGLGGGLGGKGGKVNMNLFQSMMKQNIKKSSQRDRMLKKLKQRQMEKQIKAQLQAQLQAQIQSQKQSQMQSQMQSQKQSQKNNISNDKDDYDEYIQKTFNIDNSVMKKSKLNKKKKKKKNKNNKKNRK